jgi:4-hydroxy-tetrahydrodipicolinate synthase
LTDSTIDVFSGDDPTAGTWMLSGAKGVISVTANVVPSLMAKLADLALDNDTAQALYLQEELMPLHNLMFVESNPIPVKYALQAMGLIDGYVRSPLTELSDIYHEPLMRALQKLELVSETQ